MELISLLLPLLSGAAGGNLLGGVSKAFNLGSAGNSLAGLVGGGVGSVVLGSILSQPPPTAGVDPDGAALIGQIVGGLLGGGVLTGVVAVLNTMFHRRHV